MISLQGYPHLVRVYVDVYGIELSCSTFCLCAVGGASFRALASHGSYTPILPKLIPQLIINSRFGSRLALALQTLNPEP